MQMNMQTMAGNKCVYLGCGRSHRNSQGIRFHSFPYNNSEICKKWVINCGNPKLLDLPLKSMKGKYICEEHFNPLDVLPSGRLTRTCVPMGIHDSPPSHITPLTLPFLIPQKTYSRSWAPKSPASKITTLGGPSLLTATSAKDASGVSGTPTAGKALGRVVCADMTTRSVVLHVNLVNHFLA